jgi:hypothetical protein
MSEPFCDFVGVTVPHNCWADLRSDIAAEFDSIGMHVELDQERAVLWRSADARGTVNAKRVGQVWAIGVSGSVCAGLRLAGRFNAYLASIGTRPHRVTRLDASVDLPVDAAPIVAAVAAAGRRGELSLTRKRIKPSQVETHIGTRADGAESGTVYCGSKAADVRMVVYDKQHERMHRWKLPDCGPLTRYELRVRGGVGVSLRDAAEPAALFWHFVAPDFLPSPSGALGWSPTGEGFHLDKPPAVPPGERLRRRVQDSVEVAALLRLAVEAGPHGFSLLVSEMRKLLPAGGGVQGLAPAVAASPVH